MKNAIIASFLALLIHFLALGFKFIKLVPFMAAIKMLTQVA